MPDDVLYTVSVCGYDLYVQNFTLGCAESPVGRFSEVTCKLHSTKVSPSLMFNFVSEDLSRHLMPEACITWRWCLYHLRGLYDIRICVRELYCEDAWLCVVSSGMLLF